MATARTMYRMTPERRNRYVDRMSQQERTKVSEEAYVDAQAAAFLIGYLNQRGVAGCGDNGHSHACTEGSKTRKAVRRALGFTQP